MSQRTRAGAVAVLLLAGLVFVGRFVLAPDPYARMVQNVVNTPQTYDGEHVDRLVALGSDGVRAIGSALLAGEAFPMTFVRALEQIGDERGAESIVSFVAQQRPYSDVERSTLTAASILALKDVGGTAACEPLLMILRNETAHPRVRLASAATCAELCSGDVRTEAQEFIFAVYVTRNEYLADPNEGLLPGELYSALVSVDNERSVAILLDLLEGGAPPHILSPVIDYLSRKDDPNVANAVQRVLDDSNNPVPIRLAAARALLDTGRLPTRALISAIDQLVTEASPDVYGQEIADEAQQLKARAGQL